MVEHAETSCGKPILTAMGKNTRIFKTKYVHMLTS